ncbi:hypothetical protein [Caulobacter sp. CCH9-E1]|jgi:hypothetical protein|uniref:hypothetical protein n=1 Tax=Caulobacter sp. CCH9-E1 TaxID=1768768 RepID=UPI00082A3EE2|nr:hypothetical protein [Caulobacter sp. CCH9-E1]
MRNAGAASTIAELILIGFRTMKPTRLTIKIPRLLDATAEGTLAVILLFLLAAGGVGMLAWLRFSG